MRTTIELPEDLRYQLLHEAARTGQRGFSRIVEDALRRYFSGGSGQTGRDEQIEALYGADRAAKGLYEREDGTVRDHWRTGSDHAAKEPPA
ncbi:MAG: hypothetical protein EA427_14400 [Spirochaetaceae bacterium]|nr:MAG: hypothetical protein EA427_14400 [Spirochaetaceae bacterium]